MARKAIYVRDNLNAGLRITAIIMSEGGPTMTDLDRLISHIHDTIGDRCDTWPGGWPNEIEAALIDAIFSIRARYGNAATTGVRGVVNSWRTYRAQPADDLTVLANQDPNQLLAILGNNGKVHGRRKATVVIDAAAALSKVGLTHSSDLAAQECQDTYKRAYLAVYGCGPVTWAYFGMLLGRPDVKADTWIMRFVRTVVPDATPDLARTLLTRAAERLGVSASVLDHTIWQYARS